MNQKKYMSYNSQREYDNRIKEYIENKVQGFSDKSDIVKKLSGEKILISDSAKTPIQGLKLFGKTTQIGTPTPEAPVPLVSAGDGGSIGVTVVGKNLLPNTASTQTINGITFTVNTDKSVTANGTATANASLVIKGGRGWLRGGNYIGTGCPSGGSQGKYFIRFSDNTKAYDDIGSGVSASLIDDAYYYCQITVISGTTVSDLTFYPMLRSASITDATYEPYKEPQILPVSTPNGLPGIPVTSGGNYTDETGQQWVCDEVDFGRGVYVQRVAVQHITSVRAVNNAAYWKDNISQFMGDFTEGNADGTKPAIVSHGVNGGWFDSSVFYAGLANNVVFIVGGNRQKFGDTAESCNAYLAELNAVSPVQMLYALKTPIETPLSAEELAAYAVLHTNYPNTTILNDGGAGMEVKYCTPLTSVPMVHGEADSGKILAIDEHGCVTKIEMDDFGSGSIDVDLNTSNEGEVNPINADTLGGLLASDYATHIDIADGLSVDLDDVVDGTAHFTNADMLGNVPAEDYVKLSDLDNAMSSVLDNAMSMEPLWVNASEASSFAAQTVTIANVEDYDAFLILATGYCLDSHGNVSLIIDKVRIRHAIAVSYYATKPYIYFRRFEADWTAGTFEFNSGYMNDTKDDKYCIPLTIYGIKGVSA